MEDLYTRLSSIQSSGLDNIDMANDTIEYIKDVSDSFEEESSGSIPRNEYNVKDKKIDKIEYVEGVNATDEEGKT